MREQVILRTVARLMIPFIVLFGLYVIFHGEGGPGGGFQGGVILGSAVALYGIVNGRAAARAHIPEGLWDALCGLGVLVYAGIGLLCICLGGRMLQYAAFKDPFHHPPPPGASQDRVADAAQLAVQHANHYGVFGVEMGVAITVTAAMFILFFEISRPVEKDQR